jgi:acyl carrier protein
MSVATDVERFVLEELMAGSAIDAIDHDEDLLGTGVIDSHGLLQLVTFLRERYRVELADEALTPENFQTIAAIDAFVQRERG